MGSKYMYTCRRWRGHSGVATPGSSGAWTGQTRFQGPRGGRRPGTDSRVAGGGGWRVVSGGRWAVGGRALAGSRWPVAGGWWLRGTSLGPGQRPVRAATSPQSGKRSVAEARMKLMRHLETMSQPHGPGGWDGAAVPRTCLWDRGWTSAAG